MGFFATFWGWLNGQLATYIGTNTARLAAVLEPAVVTLATLYVMAWGYLHLTGQIEEPFVAGLKRIIMLAVILGVGLHLWLYNTLIVDTFYNAPAQLAAAVIGAGDPVGTIDAIWESGGTVAGNLWAKGPDWPLGRQHRLHACGRRGVVPDGHALRLCDVPDRALQYRSRRLAGARSAVHRHAVLRCHQRFFSAWIAQLANYALITILTVMIAALLLQVVQSYAAQTAARGAAILTVDALNMVLIAVLVFLILRQVMPIAAGSGGRTGAELVRHCEPHMSSGLRRLGRQRRCRHQMCTDAWNSCASHGGESRDVAALAGVTTASRCRRRCAQPRSARARQ